MSDPRAFVIQQADAETMAGDGTQLWLLADASDCCGALGANRLRLQPGAAGARPHLHKRSSEAFYVLEGVLEMVIGGDTVRVEQGGYAVIPPGVVHSFAATAGEVADVFITLTPGVERFDYFRMLPSILRGEVDAQTLAQVHDRYDVHFV
ncbi:MULTISPECIES: cupin domain-containing protein [Lysobacter]|jgi:mannose-6-phosphate isomerase-like protein (cupin superfamily)|uniref:Cupin domain-containing protein n=1 Tax=Lysobacter gummosus TaxID=262324 RepID=A0ABY3X7C0_9GAMM|nr:MULTISPECIES: cupin domain-containing protein [Lysobacter]ALN92927.1 cupin domain protein [Lysobacter gummosus]UJB20276.1 cupin domain-containing protein [Lysobacter capsici]UJQ30610.1 cupin domain-containing protein [Lysobacter gummosus]UNP28473.1 cupin domain-containing protein [Lysobacter gummosus]